MAAKKSGSSKGEKKLKEKLSASKDEVKQLKDEIKTLKAEVKMLSKKLNENDIQIIDDEYLNIRLTV